MVLHVILSILLQSSSHSPLLYMHALHKAIHIQLSRCMGKASNAWFDRWCRHYWIYPSLKLTGKTADVDLLANGGNEDLVRNKGYASDRIFNTNENWFFFTALPQKRSATFTIIQGRMAEAKALKAKERVTLNNCL